MTKIESNTGLLYLNEFCFPPESKFEEENVHTINNDSYSNLTKEGIFNELNFKATAYYKNSKLKSINLYFEKEHLSKEFNPKEEIDYKNYLSVYVDFCKSKVEELINGLLNTKKRKFDWGKVILQVDPREPFIFAEIKYYNVSSM